MEGQTEGFSGFDNICEITWKNREFRMLCDPCTYAVTERAAPCGGNM